MLRSWLIALSSNPQARAWVTSRTFVLPLVRRFVAGEQASDALQVAAELNRSGLVATLDHLGEHTASRAAALQASQGYLALLEEIQRSSVAATVSLKPTQLGLDVDAALCRHHLERILQVAQAGRNSVCLDMEDSSHTQATLELFEALWAQHYNVSTVIQAYLRRSPADVERLVELGASVRVVKGAYLEPPELAYRRKREVDRQYVRLVERLLSPEAQSKGTFTAIATHDERILRWACAHIERHGIPTTAYEFQMLYGIRRDLQLRLAQAGHPVRVYVSYGTEWYPYFMRRLAERPANVLFLLKNLLRA